MTARKLLLLDGHSLAYRAFFALPTDLATAAGTVTNAVYGFTAMLTKVIGDEHPDLVAVAFDTPGRTFRDDMDAEYKAGRSAAPDLFKSQLPLIREVLDVLDITMIEESGVEADDVIATLATQAADGGIDVIIVTGDRDSYQLVRDPHIKVLYNRRGVSDYALYDEAGIFERTGVTPTQYPEYAALRGDPSDNLPGVPGIGEKTASKLVATYDTLEQIFENLDSLPPKQRQNLGEAQERVFKNRAMSILRRDVPLEVGFDDFTMHAIDRDKLRVLFNQLEFRTLLPRTLEAIGAAEPDAEPVDAVAFEVEVRTVRDAGEAVAALDELAAQSDRVALDARWAGGAGRSALLGLAAARTTDAAVYFDAETLEAAAVREALARLVGASGPPIVVHRAKELIHGLGELDLSGLESDTAIMAYLLDPAEGKYLLDDLALRYLSIELRSPDAVEGTLDFGGDQESERTGREAAALLLLVDRLREAMDARELTALYERFERPLVPVLARMEHAGVAVDLAFLEALSSDLGSQCRDLEAKIQAHAGETFNVNSTPQVRHILFDVLGLTPVKRTKTGPSTDADSLQKMAETHPIVADLLRYREVEKLRGTYADALPPLVGPDRRIHASFNQISTTTGRISSDSPNLQNIPVRTSGGREMRKAFVAAKGFGLLTADYSQIELRVLAHLAEDPGLIDAFARNLDVHTVTAARVFGVDEAKVDEFQRRFAKVVNYGLAYGMEAYGLGQRLDIPTDQAREILDAYFESFPNVHAYMDESVREAKSRGYTTTIFGRRRLLPELASDNFRIRQMGERMAQNAPVQGSAADIFKLAMIDVDAALAEAGSESSMILTVHDEIVLEVPTGEEQSVRELVRTTMESVCALKVPLVVDLGFGPNWASAK
ncbi:MAG TPA: DNA polymerase I [Acidimicrobiia bacterium]|nr:DNA polymerase I [Acidimicrobiia bacterium]